MTLNKRVKTVQLYTTQICFISNKELKQNPRNIQIRVRNIKLQ